MVMMIIISVWLIFLRAFSRYLDHNHCMRNCWKVFVNELQVSLTLPPPPLPHLLLLRNLWKKTLPIIITVYFIFLASGRRRNSGTHLPKMRATHVMHGIIFLLHPPSPGWFFYWIFFWNNLEVLKKKPPSRFEKRTSKQMWVKETLNL